MPKDSVVNKNLFTAGLAYVGAVSVWMHVDFRTAVVGD